MEKMHRINKTRGVGWTR